ncbi:hypothetical protein FXN61_41960 [Lentzea sp. PSKA42]|uniref:Peptidase inhibitor family I36 n=1 Tax=Lentzea indica TaxID=2604800 RepID=A0ABX1FVI1_9PSEU|nr:hypothetical protein [Lentzea indica]NKE62940.1 hypothetical protein [Lentzea indica]
MKRSLVVAAALMATFMPEVAHAESAPGCGPVTQIGGTAYIGWEAGQKWASVKQFKGCNKNWAYVYVWDSFHNRGDNYTVSAAILTPSGSKGYKKGRNRQQEVWSEGTNTLSVCTQAQGHLQDNPEYAHFANTEKRC